MLRHIHKLKSNNHTPLKSYAFDLASATLATLLILPYRPAWLMLCCAVIGGTAVAYAKRAAIAVTPKSKTADTDWFIKPEEVAAFKIRYGGAVVTAAVVSPLAFKMGGF